MATIPQPQHTTTTLARRLAELPPDAPLFVYARPWDGKFRVTVQAEPAGVFPLIVLTADIDVGGGGAIHDLTQF
jgi:hypothetical protein